MYSSVPQYVYARSLSVATDLELGKSEFYKLEGKVLQAKINQLNIPITAHYNILQF